MPSGAKLPGSSEDAPEADAVCAAAAAPNVDALAVLPQLELAVRELPWDPGQGRLLHGFAVDRRPFVERVGQVGVVGADLGRHGVGQGLAVEADAFEVALLFAVLPLLDVGLWTEPHIDQGATELEDTLTADFVVQRVLGDPRLRHQCRLRDAYHRPELRAIIL